jgi:hypothetical protein
MAKDAAILTTEANKPSKPTADGPPISATALFLIKPISNAPNVAPPTTEVAHKIRRWEETSPLTVFLKIQAG